MSFALASRTWPVVAALIALKLSVGAFVLARGFSAISDDDYARVVIAQRFADAPSLDPSGTSWLPLPFWIYGTAQLLFGETLEVARVTAVTLGAFSVLLLWCTARSLGASPRGALIGSAVAAVFPYSAYLGVAMVPELPSAALTLFGAATLALGPRERLLGALALTLSCAARYEAWPVALAFSAITLWEARKARDARFVASGLFALAFPCLWLLHGAVQHQDPLFFVARVTEYRAALGLAPVQARIELLRAPIALITHEPELVLSAALTSALLWRTEGRQRILPRRLWRVAIALAAILLLAMVGDVRGSAPTHHGERALLALWLALALLLGSAVDKLLALASPARSRVLFTGAAAALGAGWLVRTTLPREPFTDRSSEVLIGERARARKVEGLLIDAPDFGFFAVQAAFGKPGQTRVLDDKDPRKTRPDALLESTEAFTRAQTLSGFRWLALPKTRYERLPGLGKPRERSSRWVLVELRADAPGSGRANALPAAAGPAP